MKAEPPAGVVVRDLTASDSIDELTDLLHRVYAGLSERGLRYVATHQDADTTRRRIAGGQCLVATVGGRLVGTVTFVPREAGGPCAWYERPDVAHCEQLGVEPALHGHGIGSLLMDLVEERAWSAGAEEIALDTSERADELMARYRRRRYRAVGEADWAATNYRSVVLSKRLALPTVQMRVISSDEGAYLATMLAECINWDHARPRISGAQLLARPEVRRYVEAWGRPGDIGILVTDDAGSLMAAAWLRSFAVEAPGFGFVGEDIPEVSIAVRRPWRGYGLGSRLLAELENVAQRSGVRALSLSVEAANPAVGLYRRRGYREVASAGANRTMVLDV